MRLFHSELEGSFSGPAPDGRLDCTQLQPARLRYTRMPALQMMQLCAYRTNRVGIDPHGDGSHLGGLAVNTCFVSHCPRSSGQSEVRGHGVDNEDGDRAMEGTIPAGRRT